MLMNEKDNPVIFLTLMTMASPSSKIEKLMIKETDLSYSAIQPLCLRLIFISAVNHMRREVACLHFFFYTWMLSLEVWFGSITDNSNSM